MASPRTPRPRRLYASSFLVIGGAIAGFALAGCNQAPASNTATNSGAEAVAANAAPAVADLPAAAPAPVAAPQSPQAAYAFADQAASMSAAFADAPPDYTYAYDGTTPWLWRTHDNYERIVEQTADGPRDYYFAPGSDTPFFVQAADYGYGFSGGALVVVYDTAGRELSPDATRGRADDAGRYLQRAQALHQAAERQPHQSVAPPNWASQRDAITAQSDHWTQQQHANPDWQTYHAQHGAADVARWAQDQVQRLVTASQVDHSLNDDAHAQHDWQAAQDAARQHHQPLPQPPPGIAGPPPNGPPQGAQTPPPGPPNGPGGPNTGQHGDHGPPGGQGHDQTHGGGPQATGQPPAESGHGHGDHHGPDGGPPANATTPHH